ncbi:MAG TPA: hypothetical protein VF292_11950 [Rhodanobacteraceae bacterium]
MQRARLAMFLAGILVAGTALAAGTSVKLPPGTTTVPLVAITNDRDTSISEIELMLGPQKRVKGLYIATYDKDRAAESAQGQIIPLASLEDPDGAVIGQGKGVKAILLHGSIAPTGGTGTLTIKYITNGLFHRYSDCDVHLQRVRPGDWQLINAYNHNKIAHIHVKTWALGISTLENVCPTGKE